MDWKIFTATFGAIFFAELADKTQLVGMGMAAKSGKPLTVLLGSVCGYILVTSLSVLIGTALYKFVGPQMIKNIGASIFIIIGILMFTGKI